METKEFGSRLKKLREQAGLSQRELAGKVGINFTYLSKIENGVMPPPSEEVILRLAEVLNADRDELLTLAGRVPSDIAKMLKNREILQSLRGDHTQKKGGAINKRDSFSKRLRELREQAGLSQSELAEKVGVDFTYLSKIENGVKPPPSQKVIHKLAEAFNCDKDELLVLAGKVPADIAKILKNREVLLSLREGRPQKKIGAADNRGRNSMMRNLLSYKKLSRVAITITLVCAVAASLWFAAPTRALEIQITDLEGGALDPGTVGQTYSFQLEVTIEDKELLPIQNVNLAIYNSANHSYEALCLGLPLIDAGTRNYSNDQTGGGSVNVTAAAVELEWLSGYGYARWQGYGYTFGNTYGYAGPSSITYSFTWTPPSGWPEGNYIIEAEIAANGVTFTRTSSEFPLSIGALVAETSISEALDQATSSVVVIDVNINRIKDASTNLTALIPGGIDSYTATVSSALGGGIEVLAVNGVAPFDNLTFNPGTGVFSVDSVTSPIQAANTTVAELVLRLSGNCITSYDLTVTFQAIGAAGAPLNVPEEQSNSLTFMRGDTQQDGDVDIYDALFIAQFIVGQRTLDQIGAQNAASVNHDDSGDKLKIFDALFIAQKIVGQKNAYFE